MSWGETLHSAIEGRDATALRQMAEVAGKEGTRMFLNLLIDMIDEQPQSTTQLKNTA
jgi:hypothetical protein